jgi:hypothetical protein
MTSVVMVPFRGDGSGVGELTWGQREIWAAMRAQQSWIPIGGIAPVPVPRPIEDFVDAVRFSLGRHPALRTRLRFEPDGTIRQVAAEHGEFPLHVVDVADDAEPGVAAAELKAGFERADFDFEHEWPARMGVVRQHGLVTHLIALYNHIAVDGGAMSALFVNDGLTALFTSGTDAPSPVWDVNGQTPLEQLAWQRGPAGRRHNLAVQRHWKRLLADIPGRRFADTDDERVPRYWLVSCRTPAALHAMRSVVARTGTESSPVLLAAVAVALTKVTGCHPAVLQVIVNNRFRPGLADTISPIAQTGLCVVDVSDCTFDEAVERAQRSTMSTYLNAYYNPDEMTAMIGELGRERGAEIDIGCFFNDRRTADDRDPDSPLPTRADLDTALTATTMEWGPHSHTPFERFFIHFDTARNALNVLVQADTRYLPPDDMRALLHEFEAVLVQAALDPATRTNTTQSADIGR